MGLHNTVPIRANNSRIYLGRTNVYNNMIRFFGTADFASSGGDASSTDVVGHTDLVSIAGRPRPQQLAVTQSIMTPAHVAADMLDTAADNGTNLFARLRSNDESVIFAGVSTAVAAVAAASGNVPPLVTLSGAGIPDLTDDSCGINEMFVIDGKYYPIRQILTATTAYVGPNFYEVDSTDANRTVSKPVAAVSPAEEFTIVLPQYEFGPFQCSVLGSPVGGLAMPSGDGAVWNGTATLQVVGRISQPHPVVDGTKNDQPTPA